MRSTLPIQQHSFPIRRFPKALAIFGICLVIGLIFGCEKKTEPSVDKFEAQVDAPEPLYLLVVGDPELGQRISRQWSARRDGKLTIENKTVAEFETSEFDLPASVDVVIYPPSMLAELATRGRIQIISNDFLGSDEYNKISLLRHFRTSVVRHHSESWAVPLGSPNFAMLVNRQLFDSITPPETWDQLDRTLEKVTTVKADDPAFEKLEAKVDMPLAKGWAVEMYLARVAPAIRYRGKLSTVFNRSTMKPLIDQVPYIEALEQLAAIASDRSSELDPASTFELARSGQSAIAISWPALGFRFGVEDKESSTASADGDDEAEGRTGDRLRVLKLPGLKQWYDQRGEIWINRSSEDDPRVELIGFSGLVASVSSTSPNERSAWELLQWLPSKSISKLIMVESPAVGPFRASHLGDMGRWTGDSISEDVAFEYGDVIAANHDRNLTMMFPRIPGYRRYLDVLDEAVRSTISGEQTAEAALTAAAEKWDAITDELGRDMQIQELRKVSGL